MRRALAIAATGLRAIGLALALGLAALPARADLWTIEKGYTEVRFSWDNMGLSRQSARFVDVEGTLDFTPTDPEGGSVEVKIRAASVQSGSRQFDDLLRQPEFFNVRSHPLIAFKSVAVRRNGAKSGDVDGELTILGMTRPVTLAVQWNFTGAHPMAGINAAYLGKWMSGFSARTIVKRSDWGLTRGIPLVSDEIEIVIEAEFVRKAE